MKCRISILINGEDRATEEFLNNFLDQKLSLEIIVCKSSIRKTPAGARLQLLDNIATCDWIYFSDDDAFVPEDFFQSFFNLIQQQPGFDIYGGPNLTPPDADAFATLSGFILGRFPITAGISYRYAQKKKRRYCNEQQLILCNLFLRYTKLKDFSLPGHWPGGEENRAIKNLIQAGGTCLYSPEIYVYHERRGDLGSFSEQMYKYGLGRGLDLKTSTVLLLVIFSPAIAVLGPIYFISIILLLLWPVTLHRPTKENQFFTKLKILMALFRHYTQGVIAGYVLRSRLKIRK